ncbi:hypothetical protein B0H12DRAFT_1237599 [Mycena haematopus]|nr:hypothetical protein B0H12DRAFT_1237599 [Mycena haematopus]
MILPWLNSLCASKPVLYPSLLSQELQIQEHHGPEKNEFFKSAAPNRPLTRSSPPSTSIAPKTPALLSWKEPLPSDNTINHPADHWHEPRADLGMAAHSDNEVAGLIPLEDDVITVLSTDGRQSDLTSCTVTTTILSSEKTSVSPPAQRSGRAEIAACGADFHSIPSNHQPSAPNQTAVQVCPLDIFSHPQSSLSIELDGAEPPLTEVRSLPLLAAAKIPSNGVANCSAEPQGSSDNRCDTTVTQQTIGAGDSHINALGSCMHTLYPSQESETVVAPNPDSDRLSSPPGGSSDGPTAPDGAVEAAPNASPLVTDGGSPKSDFSLFGESGAISRAEGLPDSGDPSIPTSNENASKSSGDVTSDTGKPACTPNLTLISFFPSRDVVTPSSSGSTSSGVLETPPTTATSDHVNDPFFLKLDLSDFFSCSAQLVDGAKSPLIELSTYSLPPGTDSTCEELAESGTDCARSEIALCPKRIVFAHGTTPTPLSLAAESWNTTSAFRDESTLANSSRSENSNHGNGDGSSAFFIDEVAAGDGNNRANQVGDQLENAVDSLQLLEEGSGPCDDKGLSRLNSSSARSCGSCVCKAPDGSLGPTVGSQDLRPESADKDNPDTKFVPLGSKAQRGPSLLGLAIPVSRTSLQEELFQLSPLFSPSSEPSECSNFGPLFSESSFSAPRKQERPPIKLKRGAHMRCAARHSRGTDTSDLGSRPTERILIDAFVQTDKDKEVENLRRRVKALEQDLRSFRETMRRSEDCVHDSKPKSFWKKVASTDRVVSSPEPVKLGLLKSRNPSSL